MTQPMRVLVAISGTEDPAFVADVAGVTDSRGRPVEVTLVHVVDPETRAALGRGASIRSAPWPSRTSGATDRRLEAADEEAAAALLETWRERFAAGLAADVTLLSLVRHGRPEREIIEAARSIGADVLIVSARPHMGPDEAGPHSLGHVARFVTDHSPIPVLIARHSR